jgi:hypothetical protein
VSIGLEHVDDVTADLPVAPATAILPVCMTTPLLSCRHEDEREAGNATATSRRKPAQPPGGKGKPRNDGASLRLSSPTCRPRSDYTFPNWPPALGHFLGAYVCGGVTYFVGTQAYAPIRDVNGLTSLLGSPSSTSGGRRGSASLIRPPF